MRTEKEKRKAIRLAKFTAPITQFNIPDHVKRQPSDELLRLFFSEFIDDIESKGIILKSTVRGTKYNRVFEIKAYSDNDDRLRQFITWECDHIRTYAPLIAETTSNCGRQLMAPFTFRMVRLYENFCMHTTKITLPYEKHSIAYQQCCQIAERPWYIETISADTYIYRFHNVSDKVLFSLSWM
jgi:hypothetical protein